MWMLSLVFSEDKKKSSGARSIFLESLLEIVENVPDSSLRNLWAYFIYCTIFIKCDRTI